MGTDDPLDVWDAWTRRVQGRGIDNGHFLPEEAPGEVTWELESFEAEQAS